MFESIPNICIICKTEEVISSSIVRLLCQFGVSFLFRCEIAWCSSRSLVDLAES